MRLDRASLVGCAGYGLVLVIVGGLILLIMRSCATPPPSGPALVRPDTVVLAGRPVPGPVKWHTKFVERPVPASSTVTAGTPDTALARKYARAVAAADAYRDTLRAMRARGDTAPPPLPPPAVLPTVAGEYGHTKGDSLILWATRSDGSVMRAAARLRPRFKFTMGMDDAPVPRFTEDRAWVRTWRQTKHCALPSLVMAVVGAVAAPDQRGTGAAVAGGATLVGCLAG